VTPALQAFGLTKSFGGVSAVDDVSFSVGQGSLCAIIGPNGAGKSTLFNLVTNLYSPSSGHVELFGKSLHGVSGSAIAGLGLVRTFQTARVFPGMTALENVLSGAHMSVRSSALQQMLGLAAARAENAGLIAKAEALLEIFGLSGVRHRAATELAMGSQKVLEVLRALMAKPRMLLLDEPAAGLNDTETAELAAVLLAVKQTGVTMIVVEHNMALVMGIADEIIVLDAGSVVAAGTPAAIQNDARVLEAYVGRRNEAGHA
jgi:branched-chain amino acid transport system ATP-binding protein